MTPLTAALLLAAAQQPVPLPDEKALDSVTFAIGGEIFPPTGHLTVTSAGKVTYRDQPALFTTSSGGKARTAEWEIPKDEAAKLLDALAADGALDLKDAPPAAAAAYHVQVFSGRWTIETRPAELPDAVMKHLRPLLEKADPAVWKKP